MRHVLFPVAAAALLAACATDVPTAPDGSAAPHVVTAPLPPGARDALARQVARALEDPQFRRLLRTALLESPHPEGKVALDRFLSRERGRAADLLARRAGAAPDLAAARVLEAYFPVPQHQAAWDGSAHLLVGTIGDDADDPVAFSLDGRRQRLDPTTPPATPVLAVVPRETDFDAPGAAAVCCGDPDEAESGLYLTRTQFTGTFESWLKGKPEFEVLMLGQAGTSDSLATYQCTNERAVGAYQYNQDAASWTGAALLLSQGQIDHYRATHAEQGLRLMVVEDDDTPCVIKAGAADIQQLITSVDSLARGLAGGRDIVSVAGRIWRYVPVARQVLATVASLLKTNDDIVGHAVEDVLTTGGQAGFNWVIKGAGGTTNGVVRLEMR